jgi:hypothetical protein
MELIVGAGYPTGSGTAFEVPPPGVGVVTATDRLSPYANCAADTTVVNTAGFQ